MTPEDEIEATRAVGQAVGAETALLVVGPILEKVRDSLIVQMNEAAPELNVLLDLRARLYWATKLLFELRKLRDGKRDLIEVLEDLRGTETNGLEPVR